MRRSPGVTTLELDEVAEQTIRDAGAVPSFKGYHGFPARSVRRSTTVSCTGSPRRSEILAEGDLVSIDCGAILDGWHGDSAWTFGVGTIIEADQLLSEATRLSMEAGIAAMLPRQPAHRRLARHRAGHPRRRGGARPSSTASSTATAATASAARCTWIRSCPTKARPARARSSWSARCLAIEPMLTLGTTDTEVLDDDWTVVTTDGIACRALGAHASRSPRTARGSSPCARSSGRRSQPSSSTVIGPSLSEVDLACARRICPVVDGRAQFARAFRFRLSDQWFRERAWAPRRSTTGADPGGVGAERELPGRRHRGGEGCRRRSPTSSCGVRTSSARPSPSTAGAGAVSAPRRRGSTSTP